MSTHARCLNCGILAGPRHLDVSLQFGLCSTCAHGGPVHDSGQRVSCVVTERPDARDVGCPPGAHGSPKRRGRNPEH